MRRKEFRSTIDNSNKIYFLIMHEESFKLMFVNLYLWPINASSSVRPILWISKPREDEISAHYWQIYGNNKHTAAWPSLYLPLCCPFAPASYLRKPKSDIFLTKFTIGFLSWWRFSSRFFLNFIKMFHFKVTQTLSLVSSTFLSTQFESDLFSPADTMDDSLAWLIWNSFFSFSYVTFFAFSDVINHKWAAAAAKHIINDK